MARKVEAFGLSGLAALASQGGSLRSQGASGYGVAPRRVQLWAMRASNGEEREPRVVRLALDLVEYCDRIEPRLLERGKRALNEHVQDGAASALANVGEALDDPNIAEKRRFLIYAIRSAGECQRQLRGAARVRAIEAEELAEGLRRIRDLKCDLRRLIAWCERRIAKEG